MKPSTLFVAVLALCLGTVSPYAQPCGKLGQGCCCDDQTGYTTACCTDPGLWCHTFIPNGTLCLPIPEGCGANGAACCPGVATPVPNPKPCKDPAAYCQQSLFDNDYSYFLQYQANPKNVTPAAYGTCTVWPIDKCGQAGGPCGLGGPVTPQPTSLQCPPDKQGCPPDYYCSTVYDTDLGYSVCLQVPPNCGQLGAKCCPGVSNASAPEQPPVPFCNGADVYCSAPQGSVNYSVCEKVPKSPEECGGAGKPCCPSTYHVSTDKPLPDICVAGAYCNGYPPNGTCVMNPYDCGLEGKPCCELTTPATTAFACRQRGLYCPFGTPGTPTCLKCPVPYPENLAFKCDSTLEQRWNLTLPPEFVKPAEGR